MCLPYVADLVQKKMKDSSYSKSGHQPYRKEYVLVLPVVVAMAVAMAMAMAIQKECMIPHAIPCPIIPCE